VIGSFAGALLQVIEPLGLIWLALVAAAGWKFYRREKREAWAVASLVVFMWIFGATFVPGSLLATLERPYTGMKIDKLPQADAILLLGGGTGPAKEEVGGIYLNESGDRLLTAFALARRGKAPRLILGGGETTDGDRKFSESGHVLDWFLAETDVTNRVVALPICGNTRDEAVMLATMADKEEIRSLLLVTSAAHMRRAAAVVRTQNPEMAVHEVPCDFLTLAGRYGKPTVTVIPTPGGFEKCSVYLHEIFGWWYYRLRGWISAEAAAQKTPSFRQ